MVVQRLEEIKHHSRPRPCMDPSPLRARGAIFLVLSHTPECGSHAPECGSHAPVWDFLAPVWETNMSPNLVYFKAHSRGFDVGL